MFRRLSSSLPKDPEFPTDLEKLGYYINEKDQIRSITHPDEDFNFFISKNERVRIVQREAMNACIRQNINARFEAAGLGLTRLPFGTSPNEAHVPILTSTNISKAKRIILYIGESNQDLGVFAYRTIGQESISAGSALNFVHDVQSDKDGADTAIVIANMGQLLWYRRGQRALTTTSWDALPRKTGVSDALRIDPVKNKIPGNEGTKEHVQSVFEALEKLAGVRSKIDVIAVGDGVEDAITYLDQHWARWEAKVQAICVGLGYIWRSRNDIHNKDFKKFWSRRARAYLIHDAPADTPLYGREELDCNCYSSGEPTYTESIMPRTYKPMLAYFRLVNSISGYFETEAFVPEDIENDSRVVKVV